MPASFTNKSRFNLHWRGMMDQYRHHLDNPIIRWKPHWRVTSFYEDSDGNYFAPEPDDHFYVGTCMERRRVCAIWEPLCASA